MKRDLTLFLECFFIFLCVKLIRFKGIKNLWKIAVIVVVLLIGIPTLSYLMVRQHKIQTLIVNKVLSDLSEKTGSDFKVKKVKFSFFSDLVLEDFLVADQNKDTILFAGKLAANFDTLNVFDRKAYISKLKLDELKTRVQYQGNKRFNFSYLIDSLVKKDTANKAEWKFALNEVVINDGDLAYYGKQKYRITNTELNVQLNELKKDSLSLWVKYLECTDTAGIELKDFTGSLFYSPGSLHVKNVEFETERSEFELAEFMVDADSLKGCWNKADTRYKLDVNRATLDPTEVRRFYKDFTNITEKLFFKGVVSGRFDDLKGDNLLLSAGDAFDLLFDVSITGLPDFNNSFIYADFKRMYISPIDVVPQIERITSKEVPLKKEIYKFGRLLYTGSLTGFPGDFVAFGELFSEVGSIQTDISLKDNTTLEKIEVKGKVGASALNLETILENKEFGKTDFNVEIELDKPYDAELSLFLNGEMTFLQFHGYDYTNIYARGVFSSKHFNGGININDPNIDLLFTGRIDFSDALPLFDFEADINKIAPYNLHFSNRFEKGALSGKLKTKLKGNTLDNLEGFAGFYDINYSNRNGNMSFDNATLFFNKEVDASTIQINSMWLNGQIKGHYNFGKLKNSILLLLNDDLPTLTKFAEYVKKPSNSFTFNFNVEDFDVLANILELPYSVSSGGFVKGEIDDRDGIFDLQVDIEKVRLKKFDFSNLQLNVMRQVKDSIIVDLRSNRIDFGNKYLENIHLGTVVKKDSIINALKWHNNGDKQYKGDIYTGFGFNMVDDNLLQVELKVRKSSMIIGDSIWYVEPTRVLFDTTGIDVAFTKLHYADRFIEIDGKLSKLSEDTLNVDTEGFDLEYVSKFLDLKSLYLKGIITGESVISAALGAPVINSDIFVKDFEFNRVYQGDLKLSSSWDKSKRRMNIYGESDFVDDRELLISGAYYPDQDSIYIGGQMEKIPVGIIQIYLESILQDLGGTGSGRLAFAGNVKQLKLLGQLYVDKGAFSVDYLNTRYFFDDSVYFKRDAIEFKEIKVFDEEGNSGMFSGVLNHQTFKNMEFDMFLDFKNMLALNTRVRDNDLYYGTVYGTGVMAITGEGSKVHMDVNAKTENGSVIFLPLTSSEVAAENTFVRFVSLADTVVVEEEQEEEEGSFSFNMEVEATPDARVELIFDSRIGDVIKGQGQGTLVFSYDTKSDFKMYGDYNITNGEYLFTAQNVINKRFDIEPGGVIKWSGEPYNAILDLDAYYRTKASLYDLLPGTIDDSNKGLRVPVNCHMMLTENLMRPGITFDIVLPTADQETQQSVKNVLNSDGEVQRQVIYLLMFNRFYTPDYLRSAHKSYAANNNQTTAAIVTGTEFLSNQLSNWLSQISNDFDMGINYRPGDELTSQEVEVMLSTQMFDDKLSVNGNFGYREDQQNLISTGQTQSNFVGDFDVDYKLNQRGNFKLKAYSHTNDNIIYNDNSQTTQGFGFVYKEEFDNLGELIQRYKGLINSKKQDTIPADTTRIE